MPEQASSSLNLQSMLGSLLEAEGLLGAVLTGSDGLPLAAVMKNGLDDEGIGAAGARLGQLARDCLGGQTLELVVMDATRLTIAVRPLSLGYLTLAVEPGCKIESAIAATDEIATALAETVSGFDEHFD